MNCIESEFPNPKTEILLRDYAESSGFKDVNISVEPGTTKGQNFIGIVFKVKIEGTKNNKHEEMNVIVKVSSMNEEFRKNVPIREMSLKEIFTYTKLFPSYDKLQSSADLEKSDIFRTPFCYTVNSEPLNEFLVMEDISLKAYKPHAPKSITLDFEHVKISLESLARFHGLSYILKTREPDLFDEYVKCIPEAANNVDDPLASMAEFYKTAGNVVMDTLKDTPEYDILQRFASNCYENTGKYLKPTKYAAICHGDYWKNNVLFKYSESNKPVSAIILDYQVLRYSSPVTDLLFFIFLCTSQELRKERYAEMLDIYHDCLKNYLSYYSLSIENIYPRKEFDKELQDLGSFGLGSAIWILIFITVDGDEDLPVMDAEESFGISRDSNGFKAYRERIYGILQDCIEYGYMKEYMG